MEIIIVSDFGYINGGNAKIAIESALQLSKKHKIHFFYGCGPIDPRFAQHNIHTICTNSGEYLKKKNKLKSALKGLNDKKNYKKLKELLNNCDQKGLIVHVHSWYKALSPSIFKALKNIPTVITNHDYFFKCPNGGFYDYQAQAICKKKALSLSCIRSNCDKRNYLFKIYRIIRQFKFNKNISKMKKLFNIYISPLSKMILTGTSNYNSKEFFVQNFIDSFNTNTRILAEKNDCIFYIGRLSDEKGIDDFCSFLSHFEYNSFKKIVIGDGERLNELKKKYENIDFVGWKTKEEIQTYLKEARLLVFPSKWYEGSPLVTKEVMSYGIPCMITTCSSAADDVVDGISGILYESGNEEDFRKKMLTVCDDQMIRKLSINAFYKFKNELYISKDYYVQTLEEVYNKIIFNTQKENS